MENQIIWNFNLLTFDGANYTKKVTSESEAMHLLSIAENSGDFLLIQLFKNDKLYTEREF